MNVRFLSENKACFLVKHSVKMVRDKVCNYNLFPPGRIREGYILKMYVTHERVEGDDLSPFTIDLMAFVHVLRD